MRAEGDDRRDYAGRVTDRDRHRRPVQVRSLPRSVAAVGTLNGYEEASLAPKVSGRILALPVDVGDVVWPGQPVLEIDPIDARTEVERREAGAGPGDWSSSTCRTW